MRWSGWRAHVATHRGSWVHTPLMRMMMNVKIRLRALPHPMRVGGSPMAAMLLLIGV